MMGNHLQISDSILLFLHHSRRIRGGPFAGERVTIKMYPNTKECDLLAANELRIHEELQPPKVIFKINITLHIS